MLGLYRERSVGFENIVTLAALIFVAATLYSSVGHGGASGYLAAMAMFSMTPLEIKPVAGIKMIATI